MIYPLLFGTMRKRRLTQFDLASKLGLSEPTISKKLAGKLDFAPHERSRLAEFLGKSPRFLFMEISEIAQLAEEGVVRSAVATPELWSEFITTPEFRRWFEDGADALQCEAMYRSFLTQRDAGAEPGAESTEASK